MKYRACRVNAHPPAPAVRSLVINTLALTGVAAAVFNPARAVTLGELAVDTTLGQPLSARIPVELAAGEILNAGCIKAPPVSSELTALPQASFRAPETAVPGIYELGITTTRALYEPMYELQIRIQCPGTALLVRQYVLMLDLPTSAPNPAPAANPPTAMPAASAMPPSPVSKRAAQRRARPAASVLNRTPISSATYRVQTGDTLSTIAARVENRGGAGIWEFADRIFASNPDAFIASNPDLLRTDVEIVIPSTGATTNAAASETSPAGLQVPDTSGVTPETPAAIPGATPVAATGSGGRVAAAPESAEMATPAAALAESSVAVAPADARETALPAIPEAMDPGPAVFEDEKIPDQPVAVAEGSAPEKPASEPAAVTDAPAWLAALIGMLLGASISLVLLRDRLAGLWRRKPAVEIPARLSQASAPADATPISVHPMVPREPSMVVVEENRAEQIVSQRVVAATKLQPAPATEVPDAEATSELALLFGENPDVQPSDLDLDLDLSAADADVQIDQNIGWVDDDEFTALTPTDRSSDLHGSGGDTVEHLDLQGGSDRTIDDARLAETLKEALELLENDYENELTASRVIDRSKLGDTLDEGEDTLVRTGTDQLPRRR